MKICRMFVFIRIKQQFYYIAKQGYLHKNSRIGYTRLFKLQDGCHFIQGSCHNTLCQQSVLKLWRYLDLKPNIVFILESQFFF